MDAQCRLCLGQTSSKLVLTLTNDEMRLMLDCVFNFQITSVPYLTESICLQCSSTVQEFYNYSKKVERNQELLEGACLRSTSEEKLCDKVNFENVIVETTICETTKNDEDPAADHLANDIQDTIDDCQMFDTEKEDCLSVEADSNSGFITSNPDLTNDSVLEPDGLAAPSETLNDVTVTATPEEREESEQLDRRGGMHDRFLRCNLCNRLFSNSLHFKTHQREHRKKSCPICEKRLYASYLQRHIAHVHKSKAKNKRRPRRALSDPLPASQYERDRMIDVFIGMRCELCQFGIYQTFVDLQKHYRTKHGVQGYVRCCAQKLTTQAAAAQHVLKHQGTISCNICDKTFTTKSSLVKHIALLHPPKEDSSGGRGFRCRLCSALFSNKEKLINHRGIHERKNCPICGKSVRKNYMKKHITDVHTASPKDEEPSHGEQTITQPHINDQMILDYLGMRCELCPSEREQTFDQFKHLRTHYRTKHSIRGYVRCCGRQFFIRSLAAEHIAAHKGALRCHLCEKTFTARSSVMNHIATMHPSYDSGTGSYDCDECGCTFLNKLQLRLHKKRHKLTSITCSLCGKSVRSDYIQQHIATQHGEERRKLMCHICGKDFASEPVLNVHIKQHVNPDASKSNVERIQCTICNKMIRGKYSLKKHIKDMHSDASNQECTVCGKFIRSSTAMKQHLKMHQGQGREKLQCPFCAKWIKGKNYLSKHIQCLHNEKGQVFRCDLCQHESPNSQALAAHRQRVHENVESREKLECAYCGKIFKRSIYLREHIALHTGELLYTCEFCGKKFKSNANYYSHRKKNHAEELQAKNEEQSQGA